MKAMVAAVLFAAFASVQAPAEESAYSEYLAFTAEAVCTAQSARHGLDARPCVRASSAPRRFSSTPVSLVVIIR